MRNSIIYEKVPLIFWPKMYDYRDLGGTSALLMCKDFVFLHSVRYSEPIYCSCNLVI